jgi:3-dehydroquinate synthase
VETLTVGGTEVLIGSGILAGVLPSREDRSGSAILTQPGAAGMAKTIGARLGAPVRVLPDRDDAKTLDVAASTYRWLDELGVDRFGTLIGVGGGAVTDVAGFVAATYLRGVELVNVPTTLLGAVDAAIGGKNGVNLGAKNLVGSFWEPARVMVDLEILAALPGRILRNGMAEVAKAGLIGDEDLVGLLEHEGSHAPLGTVVSAAIRVKAAIVTQDPREHGVRAVLNYGHTIGHAVERAAGLGHGEAVAIGMAAAAILAERLTGFAQGDRQRALLQGLDLPSTCHASATEVLRLVRSDKKRDSRGIRMVLLESIGHPRIVHVAEGDLAAAVSDTLSTEEP